MLSFNNNMKGQRKPHLRVAVTPECNFNCVYCRAGGEGLPANGVLMNSGEIIEIVRGWL